jgi:hypothetical protein
MVDEIRSLKDNLLKVIAGIATAPSADAEATEDDGEDDGEDSGKSLLIDARTARALLGAIFTRAGKGKDEVVQIIAREIGVAVAAMLKEPLTQLAKHQKLQISFEFVPKQGGEAEADDADAPTKAPSKRSRGKGPRSSS